MESAKSRVPCVVADERIGLQTVRIRLTGCTVSRLSPKITTGVCARMLGGVHWCHGHGRVL